jgi:hypothetical protein
MEVLYMLFFKKKEQTLENKREKELEVLLNDYRHFVNKCLATMETGLDCQSIDIGRAIELIGKDNDLARFDLEGCRKDTWMRGEYDKLETERKKLLRKFLNLNVPMSIIYD